MVNTNKIKGRIKEQDTTIRACAAAIGRTPYTLGQKISNKKPFTIHEVQALQALLEIPDEEFSLYFFIQ